MSVDTDTHGSTGTETGSQETFEDVDWERVDDARRSLSLKAVLIASIYIVFTAGVIYDYVIKTPGTDTIGTLGVNLQALDWLYILTLLSILCFVVVPLYENKRMTKYYWRQFRKNKAAVVSLIYLGVIFVIGSIGPRFLDRPAVEPSNAYQPPVFMSVEEWMPVECAGEVSGGRCHGTWAHPLGTTHEGKDILVSVIYGMEVSMQVGLIAAMITITIAAIVGVSAAYFGGWIDAVLMRYVDIQITFPTFFLYLMIVYLYGGSLFSMIVIFGLLGWGGIARIVRSEALQRREEEYVLAAKNAGASSFWTMRRHLLPNVSNSVITAVTLLIPGLILFEASLAFLGLGDPTVPSWGEVIASGRDDLEYAWWISTIPGVFLFFTILAFNFIGDALRDALDPRSEGSGE
ncbi:binding-protein-dependent transport system inner membrane protein [Natrialba chahannaoensis JCM 10990]|uniref:Binding-protein-dependent transport system inner membrane protein n=1 Tax=Natrialba chahannaoensis JCM 10990 TaxID=1227492 RepID=M0A9W5_9EURY|nr:ABC transporter permease [Natrialba chahannaoensis]ELY94692.1 binding-protein-dependent transport system inner membrane protein [Natrialba chahannaoensis JCM 10990]